MMQRRPNQTELRSMDSYIQILCRLQRMNFSHPWGVKGDFLVQGSDGGGTFCLVFCNLQKIWT